MPMIKLPGVDYHYELHGSGQPLVLIAGYGCELVFWTPILAELAKSYQLLIFDNRAIGQTRDDGVTELTADLLASDVMQLCDTLNLSKPHVLGHSMGGTIAQTIAAKYPDKIKKLILVSTSAKWRVPMRFAFKSLLTMRQQGIDFDYIFNASIPLLFGETFLEDANRVAIFKQDILSNPAPQSVSDQARQFRMLEKFDGVKQLADIQAETLVLHGREDILSLPYESIYLSQHIKNASVAELPGGHVVTQEAPLPLSNAVKKFL